jgi:uncharacterized protein
MRAVLTSMLTGRRARRGQRILDARFRPVVFESADGIELAGWLGAQSRSGATIILCHGAPGDKRDMAGLGRALMDQGFSVLAFDFRNWGDSARATVTLGRREADDVLAAVAFVRRCAGPRRRIGVVGLSMGAAAAILAAARTDDIHAVVADSSYARLDGVVERAVRRVGGPFASVAWRSVRLVGERIVGAPLESVAPIEAIPVLSPRPVLIIHGKRDRLTAVEDAYALYRACGHPKALWIVEGAGHGRTRRAGIERYDGRIAEFFKEQLPATA